MYLDHGIDTGEIIHQVRPIINRNDSFHQLSNRFLKTSFELFIFTILNNIFSAPPESTSGAINKILHFDFFFY